MHTRWTIPEIWKWLCDLGHTVSGAVAHRSRCLKFGRRAGNSAAGLRLAKRSWRVGRRLGGVTGGSADALRSGLPQLRSEMKNLNGAAAANRRNVGRRSFQPAAIRVSLTGEIIPGCAHTTDIQRPTMIRWLFFLQLSAKT